MNLYGFLSDEKALAGMLYGMNPKSIITYSADGDVNYGLGLFAKDGQVTNVSAEGYTFVGVAVFHQNSFKDSRGYYADTEAVACLNDGNIWVVLDTDIAPIDGEDAYVTAEGKFTNVADTNTLVGKFKSGAENGLALVDISK